MTATSTQPSKPWGQVNWLVLIPALVITGVVALSVHVVMLQVLGIPFPADSGAPSWVRFLNFAVAFMATVVFCELAQPWLAEQRVVVCWLVVAALPMMLRETFRGAIMNGVVTSGWILAFAQLLPGVVFDLAAGAAALAVAQSRRGRGWKLAASALAAAVLTFALRPLLGLAFGPLLEALSRFGHEDVYQMPYDWHVMLPAYLSFTEPVVAATAIAALVWPRLAPEIPTRVLQYILLLMLMRGLLLRIFLYSGYIEGSLAAALLSESQFTLEALALSLLTAISWHIANRASAAVNAPVARHV